MASRKASFSHRGPGAAVIPSTVLLILAACAEWTNGFAGDIDRIPEEIVVLYNLAYREGPSTSWRLDLAMPKVPASAPRPAIVVIHGGGWIEGSRSSFSSAQGRRPGHIIDFAQLGFVAVSIDYRLAQEVPFPAAIEDCKCAVRWLRANSQKYQIDPQKIGAWGGSAGGHLALMLGMVDKSAGLDGDGPYREYSSSVQAVVSDSGPLDLVHQYQHAQIPKAIESFLNGPPEGLRAAEYKRASPTNHVSANVPPLMLIYGAVDTQVGVETADRFVEALGRAGAKDINYHRLGTGDHCPYSMVQVPWLVPAVNEFFLRTLSCRPSVTQ
jgi:acetyl esterase/lipase